MEVQGQGSQGSECEAITISSHQTHLAVARNIKRTFNVNCIINNSNILNKRSLQTLFIKS
jgi:hypothetical protein